MPPDCVSKFHASLKLRPSMLATCIRCSAVANLSLLEEQCEYGPSNQRPEEAVREGIWPVAQLMLHTPHHGRQKVDEHNNSGCDQTDDQGHVLLQEATEQRARLDAAGCSLRCDGLSNLSQC